MKKLFLLFLAAALVLPSMGQGVVFQELTIEQAVAKAKAENKYVFVDVYTDWCGPCRMMEAQVFPMKEMGDYFNPKFISVKMNAEKGEEGPSFANKYGVKAYPTFLILNGDNELVHMFAGGVLNLTFIDKVEESFDPSRAYGALSKRYDAGEREPRFVASYLQALQNTHMKDVSKMIEEFYAANKGPVMVCRECLFMFDAYAAVGSDMEAFLVENRDKFRQAAGTEEVDKVLKMKYANYFGKILQGYGRNVTVDDIRKTGKKLAGYGIGDADMMPVYEAAAIAKLSGTGTDALFGLIGKTAPGLSDNDKDLMLYLIIPGLKAQWAKEQSDALVGMVTSESTKGYIIRSIAK